jgi:hypothetical protein
MAPISARLGIPGALGRWVLGVLEIVEDGDLELLGGGAGGLELAGCGTGVLELGGVAGGLGADGNGK